MENVIEILKKFGFEENTVLPKYSYVNIEGKIGADIEIDFEGTPSEKIWLKLEYNQDVFGAGWFGEGLKVRKKLLLKEIDFEEIITSDEIVTNFITQFCSLVKKIIDIDKN